MVNTTRSGILRILENSRNPVSGEKLGGLLSVSRVAVWKHVKVLRDLGYPIHSHADGYILAGDVDSLHPWEFSGFEERIRYFDTLPSTMRTAETIEDGHDGLVVVAERQTSGRGRYGREWMSPPGGLYFTIVLHRRVPLCLLRRYSLSASAVVAETVNDLYKVRARTKWPNDVLVGGAKLAGVLVDFHASGEMTGYIGIGVGINAANDTTAENGVSLRSLTPTRVSRKRLLEAILAAFDRTFSDHLQEEAVSAWRRLSATLGRNVTVRMPNGPAFSGKAVNVDFDGSLLVEIAGGGLKRISFEDCHHSS